MQVYHYQDFYVVYASNTSNIFHTVTVCHYQDFYVVYASNTTLPYSDRLPLPGLLCGLRQ